MLIHPTLDQLKALKLDGMADAFVALQSLSQALDSYQKDHRVDDSRIVEARC
jgi:hypothetical protein